MPSNIIAGMFNIDRAEYFEAEGEQREAPAGRLRPARRRHPAAELVCRWHRPPASRACAATPQDTPPSAAGRSRRHPGVPEGPGSTPPPAPPA